MKNNIFSKYNYSKGSFSQCNGFYLIFPFLYLLDEIFLYGKNFDIYMETLFVSSVNLLCTQILF